MRMKIEDYSQDGQVKRMQGRRSVMAGGTYRRGGIATASRDGEPRPSFLLTPTSHFLGVTVVTYATVVTSFASTQGVF
jgi:hypothetical protein